MALGRFAVRSGQTAVKPVPSVIRRFEIGVKTLDYRGEQRANRAPEPPMGTSQVCRAGLVLILASAGPLCAQHRTAAIAGQLVDRESRAPVGGARIALL